MRKGRTAYHWLMEITDRKARKDPDYQDLFWEAEAKAYRLEQEGASKEEIDSVWEKLREEYYKIAYGYLLEN